LRTILSDALTQRRVPVPWEKDFEPTGVLSIRFVAAAVIQ
jgi:hypothetical protein